MEILKTIDLCKQYGEGENRPDTSGLQSAGWGWHGVLQEPASGTGSAGDLSDCQGYGGGHDPGISLKLRGIYGTLYVIIRML